MRAITELMKFELNSQLELSCTATIEKDINMKWGFTCSCGINTWEGEPYKTFDLAYKELKQHEKRQLLELEGTV